MGAGRLFQACGVETRKDRTPVLVSVGQRVAAAEIFRPMTTIIQFRLEAF